MGHAGGLHGGGINCTRQKLALESNLASSKNCQVAVERRQWLSLSSFLIAPFVPFHSHSRPDHIIDLFVLFKVLFSSHCRLETKLRGRYRAFPHLPCLHTCLVSPITSFPYQRRTFVKIDEPALTRHHPKPTVDLRVHAWCCTFFGFRQMWNRMDPSI